MLEASETFASLVTASHRSVCRVESWYDDELLTELPVAGGRVTLDRYAEVSLGLELDVPREPLWQPGADPRHPLAANGQRLHASRGVAPPSGEPELLPLGWARISGWDEGDDVITVKADGLEDVLRESRLIRPVNLGGTMAGAITSLVAGMLPVAFDPALTDRALSTRTVEEDRLRGIYDLVDAWPAEARVNPEGVFSVAPVPSENAEPVLTLTDGQGGTLVSAPLSGGRDGVYNAVIARGETSGTVAPVEGQAYDLDPSSPTRWDGPYGQVPMFYSSPLLTTVSQCNAAARTRLLKVRRKVRTVTVTAVPDPRLRLADVVWITSRRDGIDGPAITDKITMPLAADGGPMSLDAALIETVPL